MNGNVVGNISQVEKIVKITQNKKESEKHQTLKYFICGTSVFAEMV